MKKAIESFVGKKSEPVVNDIDTKSNKKEKDKEKGGKINKSISKSKNRKDKNAAAYKSMD